MKDRFSHLLATRQYCYYIPETQDPAEHGGYVPSLVIADEPGHHPMLGNGPGASPWKWGSTLAEAQAICEDANRKLGVSKEHAMRIVMSSMSVSRIPHPFTNQ